MDHKELGTNCSVTTSVSNGSTKFAFSSPTVQGSRIRSYDVGSNSLGKVDATATRPCAIIGPDRVLPPNPDDTMYIKKMSGETWPSSDNLYRRPPDYPSKMSDYQPTRNISPRQTFQENMQRILVPPTFSSMKNTEESNYKNIKINTPQEAKYCDVPYNLNSVNSEQKGVRNPDIPLSNVNPLYTRTVPPPYGWPTGVNVRPLRPYGAPEFYQYQDFPSCAGPRPMTMIRPHRSFQEESAQMYSERLYQDANIRFKPYSTGKEKLQPSRYDYISNYPSTFHPPASLPPHKYDLQKTIHGHPYPVYPQVPFKYLDRRLHEPFLDGYHRSHNQQTNVNAIHNQVVPPPYGPIPGNCMQNKTLSDVSSKPMTTNKLQFDNNNKVYLNLESRNKNYSLPENLYYNDVNHSQTMRGEILLPTHSALNVHSMPQHSIYRKDNISLKSYDCNPNFRIFDQSINVNQSLQRMPLHYSPNAVAISPSDSNTSNDTAQNLGMSQEDCGYVSQSSTASMRSSDSGHISIHQDMYRRQGYNYDIIRNTYHGHGLTQIHKNKSNSSQKKNLNVRQFLQMWNEGDEEASEGNKEAVAQTHTNSYSTQSELINNQEQLYVLGLVNVPNEELGKYDHIQKISKLPENIKGYNSIEILNQYEELLETPHANNYHKSPASRDYNSLSKKSLVEKENMVKLPRPISPLDVEAKISQSVIHKEVGCNFEIKPCSPDMLNVQVATPVQSIIGERLIEKVINPIMTKSPNTVRSDNIKLHQPDAVKVASCKMISNHCSAKNSSNITKQSNYSMQDLESNVGLCLASLPQLDNDIELNFPEINQQFIKANQMETNIASNIQCLPHMDSGLANNCFKSQEVKTDTLKCNISTQLASVSADKEFSKLSKYRKGKKCEFDIAKQNVLKSGNSTTVLQRIDSVIIKNPDNIKSQDMEFPKITNEKHHDIEKQHEQSECEKSNEGYDLPSETAIDFSLNRTEDETAINYLNDFDNNLSQQLSTLEELKECDDMPLSPRNNNTQNAEFKFNDNFSTKQAEEPQNYYSETNVIEECKISNEQLCQIDIVNQIKYDTVMPITNNSPQLCALNENSNVDIIKQLTPIENEVTLTKNEETLTTNSVTGIQTPKFNTEVRTVFCQNLNENKYINPKETISLCHEMDIKDSEIELNGERKKCTDMATAIKSPLDNVEQSYREKCAVNKMDETNCIDSCEIFTNNDSNSTFKNNIRTDNMRIDNKQTDEDVLEILSPQDIVNMNTKSKISRIKTKKDIIEAVLDSKDFNKINNSGCESLLEVPLVLQTNDKILEVVLEKPHVSNDYETHMNTTEFENSSCETEEVSSLLRNEHNEKIYNLSVIKSDQENVIPTQLAPEKDGKVNLNVCDFECVCEESHDSNSIIEPGAILSNVAQETKQESSQDSYATLMVVSNSDSLFNKSDINNLNINNDTCIPNYQIKASINFIDKLETRAKQEIEEVQKEEIQSASILLQADCLTEVNDSSAESYTHSYNTIKECSLNMKNETHLENSALDTKAYGKVTETYTDLFSIINFDLNGHKIEGNVNIESNSSELCDIEKLKLGNKRQNENSVIIKKPKHFLKELFSPWIQKLLILNEGNCKYIRSNNTNEHKDLANKTQEISSVDKSVEIKLTKNNIELLQVLNNETDPALHLAETLNYVDTINEFKDDNHSKGSPNITSPHTDCDEERVFKQDTDTTKKQFKIDIFGSTLMSSEMEIIKPRKISKRSLSESALEEYKNDRIHFLQPCKRKKGNESLVESHIISEDICDIIQTNRRNSISTFYNDDNVYIVIDNDVILTDDETEKVCYTEINEEFSTGIESVNCDTDLSLTTISSPGEQNQCEYSTVLQNVAQKPIDDSWMEDVACIETVFSEDVAENIIIDVQASPKKINSFDLENVDQTSVFYDSNHIDKIKTIYGRTICNENTQLIETLYRTPQMNVNKTLYDIESQSPEDYLPFINHDGNDESCLDTTEHIHCTDILESEISSNKIMDDKENMLENLPLNSKTVNQNICPNFDSKLNSIKERDQFTIHSCESSNVFLPPNIQKENSNYSCSSSPEVSSTTSEEKSSILLKITNCNGSRVSEINEICSDPQSKISYKLTEKQDYRNYNSNFSSSRTLITKAAQKYIPPINETVYDLKIKLPLPQHRLHTLKQLKIAKIEPKINAIAHNWHNGHLKQDASKKQRPKFEDVLKSIDEINFKRHRNKIKKGKSSIPKVVIKKSENGAHYASSKTTNTEEIYNPDLTGRKWQPWVFLEKNHFIDRMVLQNKFKAVYCHRKKCYVLAEKFHKYKSVYNANFVISQPKSDTSTKGNLKYTIRLKQT